MPIAMIVVGALVTAVAGPVAASPFPPNVMGRTICARANVQGVGWQSWRCASRGGALYVGTTGQSRRMEAVSIWTAGTGGVCLAGYVQGTGWTGTRCAGERGEVTVGAAGRGLRLEAVRINTHTGICVAGHVQKLGWQAWRCGSARNPAVGGTSGQERRLEALRLSV
jgi:uncharacterized protein YjdB